MDSLWMSRSLWLVGAPIQVVPSFFLNLSCAFFTVRVKNLIADQLNTMIVRVCCFFSHFSYVAIADVISSSSELPPLKKAQNQPEAIVTEKYMTLYHSY